MEYEEVNPEILDEIFSNFYHQEEYGDFQVADRCFRSVDPDLFLEEHINMNTKKKTDSDMKLFLSFLMSKNETRKPEYIPADQLNCLISQYILSITKKDGREYEPSTIRGFVSSIDRYLKAQDSKISIFKDIEFAKTRAVLTKKQQQLKSIGLGNKPRAAEPLSEQHIYTMLAAGTLGDATPRSLIHSMWLICTTYFGMRTGKECHDLCWGDIQLGIDEESGQEYIIYDTERQTKTRSGSNPRDTRMIKPKAYANTEDRQRDPVHLYKVYSSKRPEDMCTDDSPFFLTPGNQSHKCWYRRTPIGINKLYGLMKEMKEDAGIENARITPYSSRKRLIQKLHDEGVPANQIVQISGHKNINSINNYSKISDQQAKNISSILSNQKSTCTNLQEGQQVQAHSTPASTVSQAQQPRESVSGFPHSVFPGCHFHGNVTFNYNNSVSETQTLSQSITNSPVHRPYKRIRLFPESDSE